MSDDRLIWGVSLKRMRLLRNIEDSRYFTRIVVELVPTSATLTNLSLINVVAH